VSENDEFSGGSPLSAAPVPAPAPAPAAKSSDLWIWIALGASVIVLAGILYLKEKQSENSSLSALTGGIPATGPGASAAQIAAESTANADQTQTGVTEGVTTATAVATDAATGNYAGAATAAISGIVTQLTQHSARLSGATAENKAADTVVPAFDADMQAINAAYNEGEATIAECIQAIEIVDQNCYNSLHALVGKPGTAWISNPPSTAFTEANAAAQIGAYVSGSGVVPCNDACTVSCCIYFNNLHIAALNAVEILAGWGGYSVSPGSGSQNVPQVYPPDDSAYGTYTRAQYTLDWIPPKATPVSAVVHTL
jgi:hypothetical protein